MVDPVHPPGEVVPPILTAEQYHDAVMTLWISQNLAVKEQTRDALVASHEALRAENLRLKNEIRALERRWENE